MRKILINIILACIAIWLVLMLVCILLAGLSTFY